MVDAASQPFFLSLYVVFMVVMALFIFRDWKHDVTDAMRFQKQMNGAENDDAEAVTVHQPPSMTSSIGQVVLSNWVEVAFLAFMVLILIFQEACLVYATTALWAVLILREFFQVTVSVKRYVLSPENWLEFFTILLVAVILFHSESDHDETVELKRHFAAIVIVLSWAELITLVGKHPKLTRYNVYVTMFYKVLATFIFFLGWYAFFIVAFGLAFYIMLHGQSTEYGFFNTPWTALIKTSTMFVGELEFGELPIKGRLAPLAFLFLLAFVFLIVVVLMNLLNGLAVSDTGIIQEKAEIVSYVSRVDTISYTESVLLGDPFDFLSNWPAFKWVKAVPSLSCCSSIYRRNRGLQTVFHWFTGATGILLFYNFLPDKKLVVKPNQDRDDCCGFLQLNCMDESIVSSAKAILSRQLKEERVSNQDSSSDDNNRLQTLESLVSAQDENIRRLEQKIDRLLIASAAN